MIRLRRRRVRDVELRRARHEREVSFIQGQDQGYQEGYRKSLDERTRRLACPPGPCPEIDLPPVWLTKPPDRDLIEVSLPTRHDLRVLLLDHIPRSCGFQVVRFRARVMMEGFGEGRRIAWHTWERY